MLLLGKRFEQRPRLQARVRREICSRIRSHTSVNGSDRVRQFRSSLPLTRQTPVAQMPIPRRLTVHPGLRSRQFLILFLFSTTFSTS